MENPCYNSQTKQDCPQRSQGCAVTCEAWKQYTVKRERERALRRKQELQERDVNAVSVHGINTYKKESAKYHRR